MSGIRHLLDAAASKTAAEHLKAMHWQTGTSDTDRQTDEWADRLSQTDGQMYRQRERQMDRQTQQHTSSGVVAGEAPWRPDVGLAANSPLHIRPPHVVCSTKKLASMTERAVIGMVRELHCCMPS